MEPHSWLKRFSLPAGLEPETERSAGCEVIKPFSCSTQLSMKFYMLIKVKMHFNIYKQEK